MKNITLLIFFGLCITFWSNAQSTCTSAQDITAGVYTVTSINGTQVPNTACTGNGNANAAVWYRYTPTENKTVKVTSDLEQNRCKDTRLQVYIGDCANYTCVGGDDDGGGVTCQNGGSYLSTYTFPAMAGNTYLIVFDNKWSSLGFDFQLIENEYVAPIEPPISFTLQTISFSGEYKECVVDMNGDYLDDIVGVNQNNINILYQKPNGGGFKPVEVIATPNANYMPSWSIAAGDFDRNGYNDLLYGGSSGVTFMKANDTGTGFTQMSTSQYVFSQRSNFIDLNNDGHLDAFVCHDTAPNVYYINNGTGQFSFHQGGIGDYYSGGHYGSLWVDYDNDGDLDMFMAKCGGEEARRINQLFRNNGDGTFTNVAEEAGLADLIQTWSAAWADYDNDGYMDALVGASSFADGGHKLMRNNGDGTFSNITVGSGWENNTSTNYDYVAHDFDNDGFVDIIGGSNFIMFNKGNLTFAPVTYPGLSFGAIGDLNNDGFLDIQTGNTVRFNTGNSNKWLKLNFNGVQSNKNGIGARIEIYGAWGKQIREVRSGEGFAYMHSLNVHFGIGQATTIDRVVVRWPSGIVDELFNVAPNQTLMMVEGATLGINSNIISNFAVSPNPAKDVISIQSNDWGTVVAAEIYDITGKLAQTSQVKNGFVDVTFLHSGVYLLVAKNDEGKLATQKFIKQ